MAVLFYGYSHLLQPTQLPWGRICSSWVFMLTVVQGGTDLVMNADAPMTQPCPITVSPPKIDAFA
jgi:hypothetical protein